ncbi:MAG: tetratricopeptide repeat protein [Candidatus Korobacteraceae bacterium]
MLSFLDHGSSTPRALPKRPVLLAAALVLITVLLYSPVRHHPFVNYDDGIYVINNEHVKSGFRSETIYWAMTSYDAANWHPVTWFSHMLDYQLFKDNAGGHHDVSLLLHAVNVALLFWVLMRATGRAGPSLMVAALFALHPINTETVAWIAERKNLLSMMFFLLALGAWGWYARHPQWSRYLVVAFLFVLGLMSKPQVITLPFVLLLWDYWPLERMFASPGHAPGKSFLELTLEKLPLLALSAGSAFLTVKAQQKGGGFNPDYSLFERMENSAVSYVRYLGKALWPSPLAPMYPHPGSSLQAWQAGLALLVLIAVSALVIRFRQRRYLLVGWLWFLGTLVPMIGLLQVGRQAMADRYAYLPFVGLFIMLCWGVADWAQDRQLSPAWLALLACTLLLVLAGRTHRQIDYWGDNVTLWTHAAQVTRGNYAAEDQLGDALLAAGRPDDAQIHFLRALAIYPSYPPALMYVAVQNQQEGRLREAITLYQQVLAASQNNTVRAKALTNMGHAYRDLGDLAPARDSLQSALALNSGNFAAWLDLGLVSQQMGDLTSAIHDYFQAVTLHPFDVGYLILAQALRQSGHQVEAKWAERKARDMTADYPRAEQAAAKLVAAPQAPH